PLGGSKRGELITVRNSIITFGVIGFWHGASWNYVLFGLYHAFGVFSTRLVFMLASNIDGRDHREIEESLDGKIWAIVCTNLFIIFSLPLFRSPDMTMAFAVYAKVFSFSS